MRPEIIADDLLTTSIRGWWQRVVCCIAVVFLVAGCTVVPEPFSAQDINEFASRNLDAVAQNQEPVERPITLYEAMARALKYNLDFKVELMEKALKLKNLDLSHHKMLPTLVAKSGYAERSNYAGSNSRLLEDRGLFQSRSDLGNPNVQSSTSQDRAIFSSDLTFSWSILDFGLSYVRAKQAADEVLIAEQLKRKVVNRIIEDVRTAYWRAISYQRLIRKLRVLDRRVSKALKNTRALYDTRQSSLITVLTYERELVEIRRELQNLEGDLKVAKSQLAALMNLPPTTSFQLAKARRSLRHLKLKVPYKKMVAKALRNRPELLEVQYKLRINQEEADAALLELLPNLKTYAGLNYDSNSFLFNDFWLTWGARASWNLLNIFSYPARKNVVLAQDDLLNERAKALTMAIMTQVHISRARYLHARKELRTAQQYFDVQNRLLRQIRTEASAERVSEQTLIREEMNTLVANVKFDIAYAAVHNSYANVFASMGLDPYREEKLDTSLTVKALARSLRKLWLERGDHHSRL